MAVDREMLEAIGQLIDAKLEPFKAEVIGRLDKLEVDVTEMREDIGEMKEDVGEIREDGAITREATNKILSWAEEASIMVQIPLFKKD